MVVMSEPALEESGQHAPFAAVRRWVVMSVLALEESGPFAPFAAVRRWVVEVPDVSHGGTGGALLRRLAGCG
jgi:hypothetical protein